MLQKPQQSGGKPWPPEFWTGWRPGAELAQALPRAAGAAMNMDLLLNAVIAGPLVGGF